MFPGLIDLQPPSGIGLGPLFIGFYGLGYVLAVAALLFVSQAEARLRGYDPRYVTGALVTVAVCALVGARLYHVIDQWSYYSENLTQIVLPPYSGLGLYGGVAGAAAGIAIHVQRHRLPFWVALDVVAPGTFFAQAIARWGNFFNQELYGPPTDLPWGITIDCGHRVSQYPCDATFPIESTGFHPLFLYESLLDLTGGLVALWLSRRRGASLRNGDVASFWMVWYGASRLALETFRQGWNWTVLGVPTAMLIGAGLIAFGVATSVRRHRGTVVSPAGPG